MRAMRLSSPLFVPALVSAFACGLLASRLSPREAYAQSSALASTVYVPSDGLAFRTFDGRVIAKLSYDAHGGILEILDEHERAAASLHGDSAGTPAVVGRPDRPDLGF